MRTDPDKSLGIYSLAERCGVDIGEACDHAGIARSTPSRWRSGVSKPRASRVVGLRRSVLLIAAGRGTLPADLVEEAATLRQQQDALEAADR